MTERMTTEAYRAMYLDGPKHVREEREAQYVRIPIERELKRFGWDYYHAHFSKWDKAGFPDLIAFTDQHGVCCDIAVECKYGDKAPTADQRRWLSHYAKKYQEDLYSWACVWRETDLEAIVLYLRGPQLFKPPGIWEG